MSNKPFFVKALNVGANVSIASDTLTVGNSTVNSVSNSVAHSFANTTINTSLSQTGLYVGANVQILSTGISTGNSTIGSVINAAGLSLSGGTTVVNSTVYFSGNSTVNTVANLTSDSYSNSTFTSSYGLAGLVIGSTVINNTVYFSGNSTVNTVANLTSDSYSNTTLTSSYGLAGISVGANVTITPSSVMIGNSTVNTVANSTIFTGLSYTSNNATNFAGQPQTYYTSTAALASNLSNYTTTAALNTALGQKQNNLGFTAVQQGTGVGQLSNLIKIGWSGSRLKLTVDSNYDAGNVVLDSDLNTGLSGKVNRAGDSMGGILNGCQANMSDTTGAQDGSFNAYGTGGLVGMSYLVAGQYGIKLGLRGDGVFALGGWSRSSYSWYSDAGGNMVAGGNVIAYSDPRLKENFKRVEKPLDILSKLDGGTFNWKSGIAHTEVKAGKKDYGILADQVEEVMPEIISESIDIDGIKYKMVAYEKLIPVLIEAIKELKNEIEVLKNK